MTPWDAFGTNYFDHLEKIKTHPEHTMKMPFSIANASTDTKLFFAEVAYVILLWPFVRIAMFTQEMQYTEKVYQLPLLQTLAQNASLLLLFGIQHSVMARLFFQDLIKSKTSRLTERMLYLVASTAIMEVCIQKWDATPQYVLYDLQHVNVIAHFCSILYGVGLAGIFFSMQASADYDLFGFREALLPHIPASSIVQAQPWIYRIMRQPLFASSLLCYWTCAKMTIGMLQFALLMTMYTVIGSQLHERDMKRQQGKPFIKYVEQVPQFVPNISGA